MTTTVTTARIWPSAAEITMNSGAGHSETSLTSIPGGQGPSAHGERFRSRNDPAASPIADQADSNTPGSADSARRRW